MCESVCVPGSEDGFQPPHLPGCVSCRLHGVVGVSGGGVVWTDRHCPLAGNGILSTFICAGHYWLVSTLLAFVFRRPSILIARKPHGRTKRVGPSTTVVAGGKEERWMGGWVVVVIMNCQFQAHPDRWSGSRSVFGQKDASWTVSSSLFRLQAHTSGLFEMKINEFYF